MSKRARSAVVFLLGALPLGTASAHTPAPANSVVTWNRLALDTARSVPLIDAQAARLYAMVNVAMYDAVNGIDVARHVGARGSALVAPDGAPPLGNRFAAASAAAHGVLKGQHPARAAVYDAQLKADLAALGAGALTRAGQQWGEHVAAQVLARRADDGSSPSETQPPGSGPGQFPSLWSNVQFRNLKPFAIADSARYLSPGPPPLEGVAYAGAFAEVKVLGSAANLDAELDEIFRFWVGGPGTAQPPGEWIKVALALAEQQGVSASLSDTARLFALLAMAESDVVAPTFATKFNFHSWRPGTAIQHADMDGNPLTDVDPVWTPRAGGFGSTPEHTSGHSSFAGAAVTVLRGFFCEDRLRFTLDSDSLPGHARTYSSLSAVEAEAGRSRIYGGIHFEFSNQGGLATGRGVAREILARRLLLLRGPTHFGECPR